MPSPDRYLITLCIGVAATLAWQSYGDGARQIIASSYPQLGWLAPRPAPIAHGVPGTMAAQSASSPDQQRLNAMSLDLGAVRQSVDRIASTQERITRNVDQLTAGQAQMTREITKLQAVEQQILHNNSERSPRPAAAPARKPVPQSAQAPAAR